MPFGVRRLTYATTIRTFDTQRLLLDRLRDSQAATKKRRGDDLNAIKQIRKYIEKDPSSESARELAGLAAALAEEREFSLAALYRLSYDEFNLAIDLLEDWRLDRYYAARIRLFDVVLNEYPRQPQLPA